MSYTALQFYNEFNGRAVDIDGAYGVQCHDLAQALCIRLDIPRSVIWCGNTGYAIDIWTRRNISGIFQFFDPITDPSQLQDGDMVIFPTTYYMTPLSHVCFYYDFGKTKKKKYAFGQRQGGSRIAKLVDYLDFNQMAGAFRPKQWSKPMNQGKHKGCDVSEWQDPQKTDITGYEFLIIRAGYSTTVDKQLDNWVKKAEQYNIPYGFYWYSYSTTVQSAQLEAHAFLDTIKKYHPTMGLWMDQEDADHYKQNKIGTLTGDIITPITVAFMEIVDTAGLYCGIYASESWFGTLIQTEPTKAWDRWVASWGTNNGQINRDTSHLGTMLQYTSAGGLDKDITYIDLSVYDIQHKTEPKPEQPGESTTTPEADENLKNEVESLKAENEKLKNALTNIKAVLNDLGV